MKALDSIDDLDFSVHARLASAAMFDDEAPPAE